MKIDQAVNIEDLHQHGEAAAAEDRLRLHRGRGRGRARAGAQHRGLPQAPAAAALSGRRVEARPVGRPCSASTSASPFGISPTGGAGLFRRGADLMLAEAAGEANIPYIMSGASNDSIEAAATVAPNNTWYQLYAAREAGDPRGPDPPRRRCRARRAGADRRRAGRLEARAQHPQRLCQYPRRPGCRR